MDTKFSVAVHILILISESAVPINSDQMAEAKYFGKEDIRQDDYDIFKASSSIPFICKPYEVQGYLTMTAHWAIPYLSKRHFSLDVTV